MWSYLIMIIILIIIIIIIMVMIIIMIIIMKKSPGPDLVQGFWLKRFTNLRERITMQLNECLRKGIVQNGRLKEGQF